ncbi:alcohol oxidase, partial [Auricularia subglabra TFB-10046 SS5]
EFDYLVVGGGTAGLVVAARLSEDGTKTVGVIEAGEYVTDMPEINVPGFLGRAIGTKVDWKFETAPQPGMDDRKLRYPRGKVVGGTSAINFMTNTRASKAEYDAIGQLGGGSWTWLEFVRYFKKSETAVDASEEIQTRYSAKFNPEFHGTSGPVVISYPTWFNDKHEAFIQALVKCGATVNSDPNNGQNVGAWAFNSTVNPKTATRSYAAPAYWEPNSHRPNLLLVTEAHVTKITFSDPGEDGLLTAQGVKFAVGDSIFQARARLEVILTAGTIQTPQILELSGIGNPAQLRSHGIQPLVDLPGVGENLQDHVYMPMSYEVSPECDTWDEMRDPLAHERLWDHMKQTGKYSCIHSAVALMNLRTISSPEAIERHQRQAQKPVPGTAADQPRQHALLSAWLDDPTQAQAEIIQAPVFETFDSLPEPGKRYHTHITILLRPFSRGSVHVASADPLAAPRIDPRFFSHPLDFALFMDIVRFSLRVMPATGCFVRHVDPGPDLGEEELQRYVRKHASTIWHPVGTAAMLPREEGGVVDARLRVYGTRNLRVVDASIIPIIPSCHPQQTIYAIGEK